MKIRQRNKYDKEIHEAMNKATRILLHHISQNYLKFANEVLKINKKYFKMEEEKWNSLIGQFHKQEIINVINVRELQLIKKCMMMIFVMIVMTKRRIEDERKNNN